LIAQINVQNFSRITVWHDHPPSGGDLNPD